MTTTDTRAALDAVLAAIDNETHDGRAVSLSDHADLRRAITAHVEAEVARRLAVAPDVEQWLGGIASRALRGCGDNDARADRLAQADALRAAIAADKARAVAEATDGAVRAERFADTVCSLVGARDHGRGGQTVDAGTARLYADAVVRIGAIIARDKARPTPDEARRLVEALETAAFEWGMRRNNYERDVTATARTALLRALGVEQ